MPPLESRIAVWCLRPELRFACEKEMRGSVTVTPRG